MVIAGYGDCLMKGLEANVLGKTWQIPSETPRAIMSMVARFPFR